MANSTPSQLIISSGSIPGGILFTFFGVILLLRNFDYLDPVRLMGILKLWPLLFIVVGLDHLFRRFLAGRLYIITTLAVSIAAITLSTYYSFYQYHPDETTQATIDRLFPSTSPSPNSFPSWSPIPEQSNTNPSTPNGNIIQTSPSGTISSDPNVVKNFRMIFNMIQSYYAKVGDLPPDLDSLANTYFPGSVPINDESGQPFFYQSYTDQNGNRTKFILCSTQDTNLGNCYTQSISGYQYR